VSAGRAPASARQTVVAFVALGLSVVILANDFSALNVSLPAMEQDFDTDVSTIQWVVNAYALVFGIFIVTGGRMADLFGRKRIFLIGTTIFALFSLLGGIAPNEYVLILARALMGIGGAMMWPAILGMTYAALPAEKAGLAGGLILGAAGIGQAIGPLTGGVLTEFVSWRAVLLVNIPIAAVAMVVVWLTIHQAQTRAEGERLDYAGMATLTISLFALLFALDQGTDWGFGDPRILVCLAVFAVFLVAFVPIERRMGRSALVPRDVIRRGGFTWPCVCIGLLSTLFFVSLLYLPQFMQKILDYSPTRSGAGLLPLFVPFAVLAFAAGPLYNRLGAKLIVSAGVAALAVGGLLLTFVDDSSGYTSLIAGMIVLGVGIGLFYPSATTAAVTAVAAARQSLAGGLAYMFQIAGGAVGLAIATTIFTATSESTLDSRIADAGLNVTDAESDAAQGILAGTDSAQAALAHFPAAVAGQITGFVRDGFVDGFRNVYIFGTVLAFLGLLVSVFFVGGRLHLRPQPARDEVPASETGG
jgi:EmrB/QacA subfamily drug resistance transporter